MKRSQYKTYLVITICAIVSFIASIVTGILLSVFAPKLYNHILFILVYSLVSAAFLSMAALAFTRYFSIKNELFNLKTENAFSLGEQSIFYNYIMFAERVNKISRRHKDSTVYIIQYTPTNLNTMLNPDRNPDIITLTRGVSEFLMNYFDELSIRRKDKIAFCYYHGSFVIYFAGSEIELADFRVILENASEKIRVDNNLNVSIRPKTGIKLYDREVDLYTNIDDASIARNVAEKNMEDAIKYSPSFRKNTTKQEIDEMLQAIENNEFVVYYQPKVLLSSGQYTSSEALVRWNSKVHGIIPPGKFIYKAENGNLIHKLDMFVFERVCADLAEQKRAGRKVIPVSINFTQYEFLAPTFLKDIDDIMNKYKIDPYNIEIEIIERIAMINLGKTKIILEKLKAKGIKIAMDDYGVGTSNLDNLNKLPFNTVKIDKTLIDGIVNNAKTREIVRLLINVCHTNGMEVVAEGVDSKEQVDVLKKLKCDSVQGYFYSKPIPKPEYIKLLSNAAKKEKEDR